MNKNKGRALALKLARQKMTCYDLCVIVNGFTFYRDELIK